MGERWSLYVLCYLVDSGPARFSDIANKLPGQISNRMLSLTLDKLVKDGLLHRIIGDSVATYDLTDLGRSLMLPIRMLIDWVIDNAAELDEGRMKFGLLPLYLPPKGAPDES